jgi:hypothetical protein
MPIYNPARTPIRFIQTANLQTVNNAGLTNDNELFASVLANGTYIFNVRLNMQIVANNLIPIFDFTAPALSNWSASFLYNDPGGASGVTYAVFTTNGSPTFSGTWPTPFVMLIDGILQTGTNAGTLQLRWGQNNPQLSNLNRFANSYMYIIQQM